MQSFVIGIVVKSTIILNINVQIGSVISALGTEYIINDAIITPTD
jgi:hypothetical protein